ncbi:MAG: carboxymuconolactone decarboxylase family protein [Syntrophaceae bacterium]|nr:carboxymuconolactone decarboxylase family protein [Syntrophaceae bacterium]
MDGLLAAFLMGIPFLGTVIHAGAQGKKPRFPEIQRDQMNEAQKRVYEQINASRGGVRGPFHVLLRSPELADRWQRLGEYVRFKSSLPPRLNELAILITARHWGSEFEWYAHRPLAIKGGLAESIADDLAQNRRPTNMRPDEEVIYDFCTTLHREHFVDDALFERAVETLGERGVIDLIAVNGFYGAVSMVLNVAQIPVPPGEPPAW